MQHWKIVKDRTEGTGNSEIKPAKLEYIDIDESHRGWTVIVNE